MKPIVVLLIAVAVQAQVPSRDTPVASTTGTATISGQVIAEAEPGQPVRLAKLEMSSSALRRQPMTTSDTNGKFMFSRLPAGRYSLSVSKPGYVTTAYGAKRPGGAGVPIVVADGEQVTVTIRIARGAVISGTIRDANGEPAANVRMSVLEYGIDTRGARTLQSRTFSNSGSGPLRTDDRGAYRIYGLRAGEYYVQASPSSTVGGRATSSGEIDWAQRAVAASGGQLTPAPPAGQAMTLAPVLFPGTTDPASAVPIILKAGEEKTGVDFAMTFTPTATVSGVIRGPGGAPPRISQASLLRPDFTLSQGGNTLFIRPDAEGRFSVSNVLPGNYVLAARGAMDNSADPVGPQGVASMPLWAMADVPVAGQDITNLELVLAPGATVSGKIAFDGSSPVPDASRISVSLFSSSGTSMAPPSVTARADRTFVIPGIGPGEYRVMATIPTASGATSPWTLRSAMLGGIEALDAPVPVRGDLSDAAITFSDRPTELTGSLVDTSGKPALEYFIVVFPVDRSFWTPSSRRVRTTRPGNTGSYRIAGLPPGDYYLCAMTDLEVNLLNTSAYLEQLVSASSRLTLGEGEKKTQDFKIGR